MVSHLSLRKIWRPTAYVDDWSGDEAEKEDEEVSTSVKMWQMMQIMMRKMWEKKEGYCII
jgi:hypothetical protein